MTGTQHRQREDWHSASGGLPVTLATDLAELNEDKQRGRSSLRQHPSRLRMTPGVCAGSGGAVGRATFILWVIHLSRLQPPLQFPHLVSLCAEGNPRQKGKGWQLPGSERSRPEAAPCPPHCLKPTPRRFWSSSHQGPWTPHRAPSHQEGDGIKEKGMSRTRDSLFLNGGHTSPASVASILK